MGNDTHSLPQGAIEAISARLAVLPDLRLPAQLRNSGAGEQRRADYLHTLLLHDPGVFLERHGDSLTSSERTQFQPLRGDYEVDFYLRQLEEADDEERRGQVAKNRRLAHMQRLERDSAYFSEKEMRDRQPGLWQHFIGQFQQPVLPDAPRDDCQAGCVLAESIMAQQEELGMRERAAAQQRQWRAAESEEESSEEEEAGEEEEFEGGRRGGANGTQQQVQQVQAQQQQQYAQQQRQQQPAQPGGDTPGGGAQQGDGEGSGAAEQGEGKEAAAGEEEGPSYVHIPPEEQRENAAAFLDLMKQRFLAGQEVGVDYATIDADAELDEDWAVQAGRDAEDKYFDDVSHFCPPLTLPNATDETPRTCTFHDLYLWGGRAYYLSEGAPGAGWEVQLSFQSLPLPAPTQLLLAGGGRPAPAVQETVPLAYFWKARTVLPTPAAPCNSTSLLPGSANYYHFQAEWVPLLSMTLCEQFGHCDQHSQRSRLRIIDVHPGPCHQQERYPCWYAESMACLSDHPLRHIGGTTLRDRLVHVETAWMGVGPRCRGIVHGCYQPTSPRLPPTPPLVAHWRGQLARCLGFDGAATAPLRPLRLMVVDREFGNSRSMLNTNSLLRALRRAYPADEVEVELAYMESLTLAQQAALWSRASVVLHVHGATIANYWAAPRGAVTIQLTPVPRIWNPAGYTRAMERDLAGTTDLTVLDWVNSDPTRLHLPSGAAAALAAGRPDVAAFMAEGGPDWLSFAANFSCPDSLGAGRHRACVDLLREVNMEAPVGVVLGLVDTAIAPDKDVHFAAFDRKRNIPASITGDQLRELVPAAAPRVIVPIAHLHPLSLVQGDCDTKRYVNWGDFMTETLINDWMFRCEQMGFCSYAGRSRLQIVDLQWRGNCNQREAYPTWFEEVASCVSAHPLRHINGSAWAGSVVHVGTAWMGVGPRCRSHRGVCHDPQARGKLPPTLELLAAWRETLGQCMSLPPASAAAPLDPARILLVDRPWFANRHLVNVNSLLRALRQRYSRRRVEVELAYMEDLTPSEQLNLWAKQTVVVHVHGSVLGHWQVLPKHAVVVQISPINNTYDDASFGDYLQKDWAGVNDVRWLPLVNSDPRNLHLITDVKPLDGPRFANFTAEEKLALLRADCAALPAWHRGACNNTRLFGFNLHVKPGELTAVVDQALEVAFSSQGRPLPADLLAVAAGEGAAVPRLLAGVNDVAAEVARSPVRLAAPLLLVGAALLALTAPRLGRNTRR
ncbi:coiled-coil domain-containing 97 isoform A [Micractinium conductrix]|uniref:Coiled-coil domain-containing 97 isoform A n=1 Tax=Micractinium conductrix TaxID=554055 RepID=A0A2P6VLT1_9CHLO|nr:coiled-coil domain-containing 97 isoform A [Micractinium conductrix]|eukprot:PSC75048.1 coiled-coil domain-containing 97 isoform A [Micractinium conductrix]